MQLLGYTHPPSPPVPNKRAIMADGGVLKICFVSRYKFHASEGANSNSIKALNNLMNTSGHSCENWRLFFGLIFICFFSDTSSLVSSVTVTVTSAGTSRCCWDNATTTTTTRETGTTGCLWRKCSCSCCVIKKRNHNTFHGEIEKCRQAN